MAGGFFCIEKAPPYGGAKNQKYSIQRSLGNTWVEPRSKARTETGT
ncbi:MAG: hypothetical protein UW16_C0031G0004 [Microgenomates group bacterium GW2011_GWC1_44_10]|nr:MAG: hypothetical protein UW16_C0031G0004 [Microgenomates group bacterium GW2011_GWC1_44_10]